MNAKPPKKPDHNKTGIYIEDFGPRLHIYSDDSPKALKILIEYLEKLLDYKNNE